jgi:hypothetical protein
MENNLFINNSIIDRYAYGMKCVENALLHSNIEISDSLRYLLKKMWEFVGTQSLNIWHEEVFLKMEPDYVSDFLKIDIYNTHDQVLKSQYAEIGRIYSYIPEYVVEMIGYVFGIAVEHLYSSVDNQSPQTLKYLNRIMEIMVIQNFPLPDMKLFKEMERQNWDGWGVRRTPFFYQCQICE